MGEVSLNHQPEPSTVSHLTLPETNIAPENGWFGIRSFPFGARPIFRGEKAVSFREGPRGLVIPRSSSLRFPNLHKRNPQGSQLPPKPLDILKGPLRTL